MGFDLTIVISSPLDREMKEALLSRAKASWPFIRFPQTDLLPAHAHFALPELTDYLFDDVGLYEKAVDQNGEVEGTLPDWSSRFPLIGFALIHAECFGGTCLYSGYVCQDGKIHFQQKGDGRGHQELLKNVGLVLDNDFFAPFQRAYFV